MIVLVRRGEGNQGMGSHRETGRPTQSGFDANQDQVAEGESVAIEDLLEKW